MWHVKCVRYLEKVREKETGVVRLFLCLFVLVNLLQEGGPLPGPENGLLPNTQKWIVRGDTCADKEKDFIRKELPRGEQQGQRTQENCPVTPAVSGFPGMGLVSQLSLANQLAWLILVWPRVLLGQGGFQHQGSWEVGRLLPIGPSQILLVSLQGRTVLIRASCCGQLLKQSLAKVGSFSQWFPNNLIYWVAVGRELAIGKYPKCCTFDRCFLFL